MKRIIRSDEEIGYVKPKGPKDEDDMNFIASQVADYVKRTGRDDKASIIEYFRSMSDDYDDWWARGLTSKKDEQAFLEELGRRCWVNHGVRIRVY